MQYHLSQATKMKRLLSALLLCFLSATGWAQHQVQADLGVDLVSSYIWCGQKLDNACVQPSLSASYRGFSLEGWGSVGLDGDSRAGEIDLILSYSTHGWTFSLIDYWMEYVKHDHKASFFHFGAHSNQSSHIYNAKVGYDFGPLSVNVNTNIGGKDSRTFHNRRAYSTYFSRAAPFAWGGLHWTAVMGGTPYASDYYEASGFAITELKLAATKRIPITSHYQLPLTVSLVGNPCTEKVFFTAKIEL
jgi:hypothetical protein